jgi:hypothetical protein
MTAAASLATAALTLPSDEFNEEVPAPAIQPVVSRTVLIAVIAMVLAAHVYMLCRSNVNWDEFWFLSFVYDHARGTLSLPFQTFHVHFFGWLPRMGGQEIGQIIWARSAYFGLLLGTCAGVYQLARRVASVDAAWFAVLCCAGYTNVVVHGTSFRTDGLGVFLLVTALALIQCRRFRQPALCASAVLVALALMVTIKSAFFLPTVGALLVTGGSGRTRIRKVVGEMLFYGAVLLAAGLGLYSWHVHTLATPDAVGAFLQASAQKAIGGNGFFPGKFAFEETVRGNLIQWGCLVYAFGVLSRRLCIRERVLETCSILALLLPLFSVLFYRNTFPYFFVMLMPSALVLCAVTFDAWARNTSGGPARQAHFTVLATLAIGVTTTWTALMLPPDGMHAQREVIRAVHDIFPKPVPYIDRNGMIASFPKVGFFMSSWGIDEYRAGRTPVFANLLRTRQPKLLIANSPVLVSAMGADTGWALLFKEDAAILRDNFVPYWGKLYVAGKRAHLERDTDSACQVLIPGPYRLESEGSVTIDGVLRQPGSSVELSMGRLILRSDRTQEIVLRTTDAGAVPSYSPPQGQIYTGFGLIAPVPPYMR